MSLCGRCHSFFHYTTYPSRLPYTKIDTKVPFKSYTFKLGISTSSLVAGSSANPPCFLCSHGLRRLRQKYPTHQIASGGDGESELSYEVTNEGTVRKVKFNFRVKYGAFIHFEATIGEPADSFQWSGDAVSLTKEWVRNCDQEHSSCKPPPADTGWLPSRVLEIGEDNGGHLTVKLRVKAEAKGVEKSDEHIQFATLSHHWDGGRDFAMLRRENIEAWKVSVPLSELPKIFRDAVETTRDIGIKYLWIDALCIIQDHTDWLQQLSEMTDIFAHSALTIAATDACSLSSSLQPLSTPASVPHSMTTTGNLDPNAPSASHTITIFLSAFDLILAHDSSPLIGRAWAHAEIMLSRRTVYFSPTPPKVLWNCGALLATETSVRGLGDALIPWFRKYTVDWRSPRSDHFSLGPDSFWTTAIREISNKKLSRPEDKLAVAGTVARQLLRREGSETLGRYVAGMWEKNLAEWLLWGSTSALRIEGTKVPSWSWASFSSGVYYMDTHGALRVQQILTIKSIDVQLADGANEFGPVVGGELKLDCRILRINDIEGVDFPFDDFSQSRDWDGDWSDKVYPPEKEAEEALIVVLREVYQQHMYIPARNVIQGLIIGPAKGDRQEGKWERRGTWKGSIRDRPVGHPSNVAFRGMASPTRTELTEGMDMLEIRSDSFLTGFQDEEIMLV